jgi:hypothetical protein
VFRRRIELVDDTGERESLYAQMAQVYEEKLGKPDEAIQAYREVLALDPTSRVALDALDALFTRRRMWPELAENLEVKLSLADTEEARCCGSRGCASARCRCSTPPWTAIARCSSAIPETARRSQRSSA